MNVRATVRGFIEDNFILFDDDDEALADDDSLVDTGRIDSTGVLELITFLEEQFGFVMQDEDLVPENLDSIARITTYVEGRLQPVAS